MKRQKPRKMKLFPKWGGVEHLIVPEDTWLLTNVYETTNYEIFKRLESNRAVTAERVKKLLSSFGEKAIDIPVVCNEKFELVDGQGRYEARKQLGLPIPFIVINGLDIEDCRRLNRYNTKWSVIDWINSWANNANEKIAANYKALKKCMVDNNVSASRALRLSGHGGHAHGDGGGVIESGNLIFTEKDDQIVRDILKKGNEILEALCFGQRTNEAFWTAVRVATTTDGYNHQKMIKNCVWCRSTYHQMSNLDAELKEFTRIYNYKTNDKSSRRLYFEDYMRNRGYSVRTYDETNPAFVMSKQDVSSLQ